MVASKLDAVNYVDILFSVSTVSLFFRNAVCHLGDFHSKTASAGQLGGSFCSPHPCEIPAEAGKSLLKRDLQDRAGAPGDMGGLVLQRAERSCPLSLRWETNVLSPAAAELKHDRAALRINWNFIRRKFALPVY